jgi:hypothetical protein
MFENRAQNIEDNEVGKQVTLSCRPALNFAGDWGKCESSTGYALCNM